MEITTIDPKGDVCLITTDDKGSKSGFVVCSKILSLASKVFAALFGPRFAEGNALVTARDAPLNIELHDGSPQGMQLMQEFLHFCTRPETVALDDLQKLAVVVDKYQCHDIFVDQASKWMLKDIRNDYKLETWPEYIGLAIAFRSSEVLNMMSIGLALILDDEDGCSRTHRTVLEGFVPEHARDGIWAMHLAYNAKITDLVTQAPAVLAKPLRSRAGYRNLHDHERYCEHDEAAIAGYYRALAQLNVLPADSEQSALRRLSGLCQLPSFMKDALAESGIELRSDTECPACDFVQGIEATVHDIVITTLRSQRGLCLCCDIRKEPRHSPLHSDMGDDDFNCGYAKPILDLLRRRLGPFLDRTPPEEAHSCNLADGLQFLFDCADMQYEL